MAVRTPCLVLFVALLSLLSPPLHLTHRGLVMIIPTKKRIFFFSPFSVRVEEHITYGVRLPLLRSHAPFYASLLLFCVKSHLMLYWWPGWKVVDGKRKKKKEERKINFGVNLDICEKEKATYIVCNEMVLLLYICTK